MERKSKYFLQALRIALGCCLSIWIAELLHLEYAISAGAITFLSVITTRWESLRIMGARIASYLVTAVLAGVIFHFVQSRWIAFGFFMFLLVLVIRALGWDSTLAVNVVIGTHFLANMDFGLGFILNELMLVLVGTAVGVFVNLFQNTSRIQKLIRQEIAVADRNMQEILRQIVKELTVPESSENVWKQLEELETHLQQCLAQAHEYRENHFAAHPEYYVGYFEMRIRQCVILRSLQNEIRRIRQFPEQARMVAEFIAYVGEHVLERNEPAAQMNRLERLFLQMKETPLPASREEFENRAILYHILMDLEEFLKMKKKFVDSLTEDQMERYWQSNG